MCWHKPAYMHRRGSGLASLKVHCVILHDITSVNIQIKSKIKQSKLTLLPMFPKNIMNENQNRRFLQLFGEYIYMYILYLHVQ